MSNNNYSILVCPICGIQFRKQHSNQCYCGSECARKAKRTLDIMRNAKAYKAKRDAKQLEFVQKLAGLISYDGEMDWNKVIQLLDEYCIMKR